MNNKSDLIIVTGGAGFIGSNLVTALNTLGLENIIVVDSLNESEKWKNLVGLNFTDYLDKKDFIEKIAKGSFDYIKAKAIFHLGACSRTTERDSDYLLKNNTIYTKKIALYAIERDIPFFYASSAATYGDGKKGYLDDEEKLIELNPSNAYGFSKHLFDLWAHKKGWLKKITGFKFFNVFGPNESHKTGMTSIVYNAYHQIKETGMMKLFKSDNPSYKDGEQKRDFVYVKDVVSILVWFLENPGYKGIYNIGSGNTTTWKYITECVFKAMNRKPDIEYIDMPEILKGKYQYFTCASIEKLKKIYPMRFTSTENSVKDYVENYLMK
ncbi:MAG: hypothetical protein ACD_79C01527G0002 [uncultured bacterium]|nr:MAG: hypothetical protein ACD_79C01527G0002 [uncultured bacterium]